MSDNPLHITQLLDSVFSQGPLWVYLVLFAACFIENIFPPFPGDSFILAAGGLAATARLDLYAAFTIVVVAGLSSVMIMYYTGRRYGRRYFLKKDFKYFSAADIMRVERYLAKWGGAILILSRFIVGFRSAIAVGAGIGRYHTAKMLLYSLLSYVLFVALLMYVAVTVVDNFDVVARYISTYHRILWPIVIVLLLVYVARRFVQLRKRV